MSDEFSILLRLLSFIPLLFITYQVVLLRQILNSRAWTLLSTGFVVFVALSGVRFFWTPPTMLLLAGGLLGYAIIAGGFYTLRQDLLRIMRRQTTNVTPPEVPHNRRSSDA